MKDRIKKMFSTLVSVALIIACLPQINANAYWGSSTFNDGVSTCTAYSSISSTAIYVNLTGNPGTFKTIDIYTDKQSSHTEGTSAVIAITLYVSNYTYVNIDCSSNGFHHYSSIWA